MQFENSYKEFRFYEIRFRGKIAEWHFRWFEGLEIIPLPGGEMLIKGRFVDQPALFGVLNHLRDLNLELLDVKNYIEGQDE